MSTQPDVVIRGGRVVDADRRADGRRASIADGRIAAVGDRPRAADTRPRRRRLRRRPRPRRPAHPPARAGPGGGRDGRDRRPGRGPRRLHRGRRHAQHRAGHRLRRRSSARCSSSGATAPVRRARGGRHHRRPGGRAAGADGRDGRPRRAPLHRRRHRRAGRPPHAPGPGVRRPASASTLAQHCEDDARWPAAATCTRGSGRAASASPASPAEAEELMVMRDIALARLTGARVHFQHLSTAGSVAMVRGGQGRRPAGHRRGHAAPLHPHRRRAAPATTRCSRSTRRCAPAPTSPRCRPAWPTAPSTPSPPTTRRTPRRPRSVPFDQAPPGMLGLETALALALTELGPARDRGRRARRCCRGSRPRIAGLGDTTAARSPRAGRPTSASSTPTAAWVVDAGGDAPAAAATRPTPAARCTGRVRHTVLRGEARRRRRRGPAMTGGPASIDVATDSRDDGSTAMSETAR